MMSMQENSQLNQIRAANLRILRQVVYKETQEDFAKRIYSFYKQGNVSRLETLEELIGDVFARQMEVHCFKDLALPEGWFDLPFTQLVSKISKEEFEVLRYLKLLPKSSTDTLLAFLKSLK